MLNARSIYILVDHTLNVTFLFDLLLFPLPGDRIDFGGVLPSPTFYTFDYAPI